MFVKKLENFQEKAKIIRFLFGQFKNNTYLCSVKLMFNRAEGSQNKFEK